MLLICLVMMLISLALCLPLTAAVLVIGQRWELMDRAGDESHKRGAMSVPNTGGIAIFWSVAGPLAVGLLLAWVVPEQMWRQWSPVIAEHLGGLRRVTGMGGGVLVAMAVLHGLGLIDDRKSLGAFSKLAVQALVAAALVLFCDMRILRALADPQVAGGAAAWGNAASIVLSVLWIVVIINAFNFLDNMDGLSAGVGAIIAGLYMAATVIGQQWFVAALTALLLGALVGFLVYNFPPAKLFMGDSGSLIVGLLLAVVSIRTTYFNPDAETGSAPGQWYGVLMPVMVMAIPLYDVVSVTVIRVLRRRSPFRGDQNHFSHRLVRMGLNRRQAVLVIWLCTLGTGLSGVMLGSLRQWQAVVAAGQTVAILAILALIENSARSSRRRY